MTRSTTKKTEKPEKATRRQRSPQEKAQEALDIETRRVEGLNERIARLEKEIEPLKAELTTATRRRDYLALSPDLEPAEPSTPSKPEDDQ